MKLFKWMVIGLTTLALVASAFARTKVDYAPSKIYDIQLLDGNNFNMYVTNYGKFGQAPSGSDPGAWWPANRRLETYIYGAGPWVAARTKDGDTVVTFFYNPNSGQSEGIPLLVPTVVGTTMTPDLSDILDYNTAIADPSARVYLYGKENGGYPWPLHTSDGADSVVSTLDSYTWFGDLDPNAQESGSKPLGLAFEQTTYQFGVPGLNDIVFLIWEFTNVSGDTLYEVYFGACYDNDIGNESGANANDLVGFNRTYNFPEYGEVLLNLAYQYQTEPEPGWIGVDGHGLPGVVGSVFLESPIATDTVVVIDTIGQPVGPDTVYPGEQLGMTAFKIFTIQIDPRNDQERYSIMAGWDPPEAGGRYNPYQEDTYGPGDKRFIQVSGPFTMPPGASARMVVAAVIAADSTNIKYVAKKAIDIYNNSFLAPQPPAKPSLYAWAKDREVYLYWDNTSEITRDRFYDIEHGANPLYREYDFEGYILRRSVDGEHWDTLGQWDLKNGYTIIYTDSLYNATGEVVYTDSLIVGSDVGLVHSYVDKDTVLVNGVTYYYELIPYDLNYSGGTWFSLQGAPGKAAVTPHTNPIDEISPEIAVEANAYENALKYDGLYVLSKDPDVLVPGTYTLMFRNYGAPDRRTDSPTDPGYPDITITVLDENGDTVVPEASFGWVADTNAMTAKWTATLPNIDIAFNGIAMINPRLEMNVSLDQTYYTIDKELFDATTSDSSTWKITSVPGANPWTPILDTISVDTTIVDTDTVVTVTVDTLGFKQQIKHRGFFYPTTYRIVWRYIGADTVTLEVWDTIRNVQIPFDSLMSRQDNGYGWAFISGLPDTFRAMDKIPVSASCGVMGDVFALRLPGGDLIGLTDFGSANPPADGTEWIISTISGIDYTRMPLDGESYELVVTPAMVKTDYSLDEVKVVPNPYFVLTPLDLSKEFRVGGIRFTHLPREATIRIYTMGGDLVKIIHVTPEDDGEVTWDLLTEFGTRPASGVYLYHIKTPDGKEKIGKFAVIF